MLALQYRNVMLNPMVAFQRTEENTCARREPSGWRASESRRKDGDHNRSGGRDPLQDGVGIGVGCEKRDGYYCEYLDDAKGFVGPLIALALAIVSADLNRQRAVRCTPVQSYVPEPFRRQGTLRPPAMSPESSARGVPIEAEPQHQMGDRQLPAKASECRRLLDAAESSQSL